MQDEVFYSRRQGSLLRANELVQTKLSVQLGEEPVTHVGYIYQAISGSESGCKPDCASEYLKSKLLSSKTQMERGKCFQRAIQSACFGYL